jgi:hypothetical protein
MHRPEPGDVPIDQALRSALIMNDGGPMVPTTFAVAGSAKEEAGT